MRQCLKILAVEEEEVQEVVQPEEESQRFSEHKLQEGVDEGARVTSEEVVEAEEVAPCGDWVWPWLAELSSTEPRLSGVAEAIAEMEAQGAEPRGVGGARAALPELLLRMSGGEEVAALGSCTP